MVEGANAKVARSDPLFELLPVAALGRRAGKWSSLVVREIAARVGVTDRYVSRIVDLAFLAPDVA